MAIELPPPFDYGLPPPTRGGYISGAPGARRVRILIPATVMENVGKVDLQLGVARGINLATALGLLAVEASLRTTGGVASHLPVIAYTLGEGAKQLSSKVERVVTGVGRGVGGVVSTLGFLGGPVSAVGAQWLGNAIAYWSERGAKGAELTSQGVLSAIQHIMSAVAMLPGHYVSSATEKIRKTVTAKRQALISDVLDPTWMRERMTRSDMGRKARGRRLEEKQPLTLEDDDQKRTKFEGQKVLRSEEYERLPFDKKQRLLRIVYRHFPGLAREEERLLWRARQATSGQWENAFTPNDRELIKGLVISRYNQLSPDLQEKIDSIDKEQIRALPPEARRVFFEVVENMAHAVSPENNEAVEELQRIVQKHQTADALLSSDGGMRDFVRFIDRHISRDRIEMLRQMLEPTLQMYELSEEELATVLAKARTTLKEHHWLRSGLKNGAEEYSWDQKKQSLEICIETLERARHITIEGSRVPTASSTDEEEVRTEERSAKELLQPQETHTTIISRAGLDKKIGPEVVSEGGILRTGEIAAKVGGRLAPYLPLLPFYLYFGAGAALYNNFGLSSLLIAGLPVAAAKHMSPILKYIAEKPTQGMLDMVYWGAANKITTMCTDENVLKTMDWYLTNYFGKSGSLNRLELAGNELVRKYVQLPDTFLSNFKPWADEQALTLAFAKVKQEIGAMDDLIKNSGEFGKDARGIAQSIFDEWSALNPNELAKKMIEKGRDLNLSQQATAEAFLRRFLMAPTSSTWGEIKEMNEAIKASMEKTPGLGKAAEGFMQAWQGALEHKDFLGELAKNSKNLGAVSKTLAYIYAALPETLQAPFDSARKLCDATSAGLDSALTVVQGITKAEDAWLWVGGIGNTMYESGKTFIQLKPVQDAAAVAGPIGSWLLDFVGIYSLSLIPGVEFTLLPLFFRTMLGPVVQNFAKLSAQNHKQVFLALARGYSTGFTAIQETTEKTITALGRYVQEQYNKIGKEIDPLRRENFKQLAAEPEHSALQQDLVRTVASSKTYTEPLAQGIDAIIKEEEWIVRGFKDGSQRLIQSLFEAVRKATILGTSTEDVAIKLDRCWEQAIDHIKREDPNILRRCTGMWERILSKILTAYEGSVKGELTERWEKFKKGILSEDAQNELIDSILLGYDSLKTDERLQLGPNIFLQLPKNIQRRVIRLVEKYSPTVRERGDIDSIVERFNALTDEQREKVNEMSLEEFHTLSAVEQDELLFAIYHSDACKNMVQKERGRPPTPSEIFSDYRKAVVTTRHALSNKEYKKLLSITLSEEDRVRASPLYFRRLGPKKMEHAYDILQEYGYGDFLPPGFERDIPAVSKDWSSASRSLYDKQLETRSKIISSLFCQLPREAQRTLLSMTKDELRDMKPEARLKLAQQLSATLKDARAKLGMIATQLTGQPEQYDEAQRTLDQAIVQSSGDHTDLIDPIERYFNAPFLVSYEARATIRNALFLDDTDQEVVIERMREYIEESERQLLPLTKRENSLGKSIADLEILRDRHPQGSEDRREVESKIAKETERLRQCIGKQDVALTKFFACKLLVEYETGTSVPVPEIVATCSKAKSRRDLAVPSEMISMPYEIYQESLFAPALRKARSASDISKVEDEMRAFMGQSREAIKRVKFDIKENSTKLEEERARLLRQRAALSPSQGRETEILREKLNENARMLDDLETKDLQVCLVTEEIITTFEQAMVGQVQKALEAISTARKRKRVHS